MILGFLLNIPLILSLILFVSPKGRSNKIVAVTGAVITFIISIFLLDVYLADPIDFPVYHPVFFHSLNVEFKMGLDGISMLLVLLTSFLFPIILYSTDNSKIKDSNTFYALMLLTEMALLGVFTARNVLVFYIFWEIALIPIYFLSAIWGGKNARRATIKFFIYTLFGGLAMLAAVVYLYVQTPVPHSFSFDQFYRATLSPEAQPLLLIAFFLAFAIKIPVFPFHSWQPGLYDRGHIQGTMVLAGIMLKMGIYGLFRFILPIFPVLLEQWGIYIVILAVIGVIYASIVAMNQRHLKKLFAYSSMAHVGIVAAGVMSRTVNGMEGAMLQMLSHGINIVALFYCYQIIRKRTTTSEIKALGGIATQAPRFAVVFMIILLANIGFPLTNSFIGEFLILSGLFTFNPYVAAAAGLSVILGAVYMLTMYQRVMLGEANAETAKFSDLNTREMVILVPLLVMIFWIGLQPGMFLSLAQSTVQTLSELPH